MFKFIKVKANNIMDALRDFDKEISRIDKSKFILYADMFFSRLLYGSKPDDYLFFEFYDLPLKERDKFLTQGRMKRLNKQLNSSKVSHKFSEKHTFNKEFKEFIKRDWLYIPETGIDNLESFITKHNSIIVKPTDMSQGKGIFKINSDQILKDINQFYEEGIRHKYIIEEIVHQSDYISRLNPYSLNTLRINTLIRNNKVRIVGASLRMGSGKVAVDNLSIGGVATTIDLESGIIKSVARNKKNEVFAEHPYTNTKIVGFNIKDWDEVICFAKMAAYKLPKAGYVGWDIGVTDKGLELIEGNYYSCWQLLQIDKIGRYHLFK